MAGYTQSPSDNSTDREPHFPKSFYATREQRDHSTIHRTIDTSAESPQKLIYDEVIENFYSETYFNELVALEAQRTYRSGRPFLLVYVDVSRLINNENKQDSVDDIARLRIVDLLIKKLFISTREIDIKGWMRKDRIIGVLCTEIHKNNSRVIVNKIRKNLARSIDERYCDDVEIRWKLFPTGDTDIEKTRVISLKELIDDVPSQNIMEQSISLKCARASKRVIDVIGSLFAVLVFFPFFVGISLLIKLSSRGPVLFKQERVGESGKTFTFLKFRSMKVDNNTAIHKEFVSKFISGEIEEEDSDEKSTFKLIDDPRITKIGKFIRKTSLDELPQFLNVLQGDMSLVGPRPPIPYEVDQYDHWHTKRVLNFRPGITGFWQVEGRSATNFNDMVRMDIQYMKNWSIWLDLKLIFKTPMAVFAAKGAC